VDELPREAFGVRPACWRCRKAGVVRKREQAGRTPNASRSSPAALPRCAFALSPHGMVPTQRAGRAAPAASLILSVESRHQRAMVGADAPVGNGEHVSLAGHPFARQTRADEEEINAAVSVLFA
jgi:hypothetical protein